RHPEARAFQYRCAARHPASRHLERRPQDPRHGDHRRTGAGQAGYLWWCGGLHGLERQYGHRYCYPHRRHQERHPAYPSRCRGGGRFHSAPGVERNHEQGPCHVPGGGHGRTRSGRLRSSIMSLVMIDNYDSFTYNVVQYLCELGANVHVVRNDEVSVAEIRKLNPTHLVISPGPCSPNEAGISMEAIQSFAGEVPILGICLGHQSIGQVFGGKIVRAGQVMHGKTSQIHHQGVGVFSGLPSPYEATRYHSLVIDKQSLPDCLEVTAWTENPDGSLEEIMGIRHKSLPIEGVQFHPESILTQYGHELLANFLRMTI